MSAAHVIAIDLGASSGRVMDAAFDGAQLSLREAHRFPNIPVQTPTRLHWDVLRLWHEITRGIDAVAGRCVHRPGLLGRRLCPAR